MSKDACWVGLDVHAETIAGAVADADGQVLSMGTIPNRPESIRGPMKKLGRAESLRVCYEAGPTGFVVYWLLTGLGVKCEVVAPTLVPVKVEDRVKTDRRDAEKPARGHGSGELTAVWVPDAFHEALRDLVRAREAAKADQLRARHGPQESLLRHGRRAPEGVRSRTQRPWESDFRGTPGVQQATERNRRPGLERPPEPLQPLAVHLQAPSPRLLAQHPIRPPSPAPVRQSSCSLGQKPLPDRRTCRALIPSRLLASTNVCLRRLTGSSSTSCSRSLPLSATACSIPAPQPGHFCRAGTVTFQWSFDTRGFTT